MPKTRKTAAQLDRDINEALNAKDRLSIGTFPTGISYAKPESIASAETRLEKAHRARIIRPTNETREDERRAERHLKTLGGDPSAVYEMVREANWRKERAEWHGRPKRHTRHKGAQRARR